MLKCNKPSTDSKTNNMPTDDNVVTVYRLLANIPFKQLTMCSVLLLHSQKDKIFLRTTDLLTQTGQYILNV